MWERTLSLENWKTGKLENWKTGKLENWKTGKLKLPHIVKESSLFSSRVYPVLAFQKQSVPGLHRA
ncbi:hypothetical protein NM22_09790 [Vibrio tubiashii]|nr:hypothetical protein NM22_09790 [Vibrio tubiashii]